MNPTTPGFRPRAIGLAALAALLTACSPEPAPVAPNVRPAYVVEVRTGGGEALEWAGEVRAARRAELGFAVAGRVAAVAVEVGDAVRAGQVLARLDEQPLRAQLAAAAAEQARAEAQQAEARQRWQRLSTARQAGAASAAEAGAAQAELATAEAALQAAQAQRALAAWQLEQATLRAPMAGVVGARQLEPGQSTGPGAPALAIDGAGRELAILVPATLALKPGQTLALRQGARTEPSRVLRVASRLEAGGVRRVHLAVPDAAEVGSVWSAAIETPGTPATPWVPMRAVLPASEPGQATLLRLGAGNRTERVAVTLGAPQGDWVAVRQGLTAGDRVVVAGAVAIAPGTVVAPVAWPEGAR